MREETSWGETRLVTFQRTGIVPSIINILDFGNSFYFACTTKQSGKISVCFKPSCH